MSDQELCSYSVSSSPGFMLPALKDSGTAISSNDQLTDPPPKSSKLECLQLDGNDFKGWFLKLDRYLEAERIVDFEKSGLCSCI